MGKGGFLRTEVDRERILVNLISSSKAGPKVFQSFFEKKKGSIVKDSRRVGRINRVTEAESFGNKVVILQKAYIMAGRSS